MTWCEITENPVPPHRVVVDRGTVGKRIPLRANFFPVEMKNPHKTLIHYDVNIKKIYNSEPQDVQLPKSRRRHIFENLKKSYPKIFQNAIFAFDGEKNAYSVGCVSPELEEDEPKVFEVSVEGKPKAERFLVSMKMVNKEKLQSLFQALADNSGHSKVPNNIMHMVDVFFHNSPSLSFEQVGGNSFFDLNGKFGPNLDIGGGKEVSVGFSESLRPVGWKKDTILLNFDVAHAAYYKVQSVLDFMVETLECCEDDFQSGLTTRQQHRLKKKLKNLKVQVTHTDIPRVYKVQDVAFLGADRLTFPFVTDDGDAINMSVQSYFRLKYDIELKYPKLKCL